MNLYRANFHFRTDMFIPQEAKDLYIEAYNLMRTEAVILINPKFEEWNAQYTKKVMGEFDPEYNGYLADKQQVILDDVNRRLSNSPVKLFVNRETADIEGKFNFMNREVTMFLTLAPIDYKLYLQNKRGLE